MQFGRRADGARREVAAAVGAAPVQLVSNAIAAERALESADHRVRRIGGQILVTALAIGAQLKHGNKPGCSRK